jgi:hypothetical protein
MSVLAADLIRQGATCSLCGQGFSSANPPTVPVVGGVLYGAAAVDKAICTIPPYIERHNDQSALGIFYQTAVNPQGFITVMKKDLDV